MIGLYIAFAELYNEVWFRGRVRFSLLVHPLAAFKLLCMSATTYVLLLFHESTDKTI